MKNLKNLRELAEQESGIVIILYNGRGALYNWGNAYRSPRTLPPNLIECEEIPEIEGRYTNNLPSLLENVNIENLAYYNDGKLPKSGTVYQVNDEITVIAPDGWV